MAASATRMDHGLAVRSSESGVDGGENWHTDESSDRSTVTDQRFRVLFRAWIQVDQALGVEIVNADEAVIISVAYESDSVGVGAHTDSGNIAACVEQGLCFGRIGAPRPPYLTVREEGDLIARGRYHRVVAFAQLSRIASCNCDEPDVFCNTIRCQRRIWSGFPGNSESPPRT